VKNVLDRQREEVRAKLSAERGLERQGDPSGGTYLFDGEGRRWAWTGTYLDLGLKP
jgi:hypothetical protein